MVMENVPLSGGQTSYGDQRLNDTTKMQLSGINIVQHIMVLQVRGLQLSC